MPGLAIYLTLDAAKSNLAVPGHPPLTPLPRPTHDSAAGGSEDGEDTEIGDVVSFVTGLLLSPDQQQRAWFSLYIKNAQKVCIATCVFFRQDLIVSSFICVRLDLDPSMTAQSPLAHRR